MKKTMKITCVILAVMMVFATVSTVFAAAITPSQITGGSTVDTSGITNLGNKLVTVLTTVGVVLSVIMLIVLGIKYMMGSAEEKAEYKKTMMPYLVGAVLIFSASVIANVVYNFAKGA